MSGALTADQLKAALPIGIKKNISPILIMNINNTLSSPEEWDMYKENLLTYTSVLQHGKFRMEQYISAVRYVSFKVMGCTNKDAYIRTFPEKYARFKAEGVSEKDIASYTTAYNKSKLVNLIFEQTLIPTHIINAPIYQKAINTLAAVLMDDQASNRDKINAADSLLNNLKAPETKKVELDISVTQNTVIDDYEMMMSKMVSQQMKLIQGGADVKTIANAPIKASETVVDV